MNIILNHSSMVPIYEQIVRRMKDGVGSGELPAGSMLPSVRVLSAELQISALTVKKAYDRLEEEGVIVTVHGKGSFVAGNVETLVQETNRREVEQLLRRDLELARLSGLDGEEIRRMVEMILEEE